MAEASEREGNIPTERRAARAISRIVRRVPIVISFHKWPSIEPLSIIGAKNL
jgi:hypothetical protein